MDGRTIAYWITTGLTAAVIGLGGVADALARPEVLEIFSHLGYPPYFATWLGLWKIAGALVIVAPGLPRIKEWAYAGIVIDLMSAAFSHASVGDELGKSVFPLLVVGLALGSWTLRPETRRLAGSGA